MSNIEKIHNNVLNLLLTYRKANPDFYFTLRQTNRRRRLEKGYWFYGNENYLAISFWEGKDWKNKTPNIFFRILATGRTHLELTAKDSEEKANFFQQTLTKDVEHLQHVRKNVWRKSYSNFQNKYLQSLKSFILQDKLKIDGAISSYLELNFGIREFEIQNTLGFIKSQSFEIRLEKVLKYKDRLRKALKNKIPASFKHIVINNIPPITKLTIDIPNNTQWIFLTGLNGTGKTSILKALAAALCHNWDNGKQIYKHNFNIDFKININSKITMVHVDNYSSHTPKLISRGLAVYGASRQAVGENSSTFYYEEKSGLTYSIFNTDGLLRNLSTDLEHWIRDKIFSPFENVDERIDQITELLADLIPSLIDIKMPIKDSGSQWSKTLYVEEDENEDRLPPVEFIHLASGMKSLVAMFGDMLSRLFAQQPEISDPAELEGIVIIDEIDIHLHPILQKRIVELLTETFPFIQFIASTHSPIPFLGAPENTVIYNITRSAKEGTTATRVNNLDFSNMLPNVILTSPVFGMEELRPSSNKDLKDIITDDHYNEEEFFKIVERKIDELSKRIN